MANVLRVIQPTMRLTFNMYDICLHSFDVRIPEHGSLGTRLYQCKCGYAPTLKIHVFSKAQMKFLTLTNFQSNLCS